MYDTLLFASLLLFLAVSLAYVRTPSASLAHPASFYLAFHGFIFVLRPLFARWYDFDFVYQLFDFQPSLSNKITVILGANLAMLVFVTASALIASRPAVSIPASRIEAARARMFWPIMTVVGLLTPLALGSQIGNWSRRINDFDAMVRDAATGATINIQGNGWFTDAALMMAPMAVMLVWLARYRWWGWIYFALFAFLQAGTGTRHALIYCVAAIATCWLLENGRRWFDWRAVGFAALAGIAFNVIVIDRGGAVRALVDDDLRNDYYDARQLDPLEHMDFANLEYFEYLVYVVPERSGTYDYFAHTLQIFTEPIPRALWKDKPVGSPIQRFSLWDYGQPVGMTGSLPGVGWMSLGYPGIVIQALIFALIFGFAHRYLLTVRDDALSRLAYALLVSMTVLGFRDGTLLTLLRTTPFYFGPLVLALLFARMAVPTRSARAKSDWQGTTPAQRRAALAARAPNTVE